MKAASICKRPSRRRLGVAVLSIATLNMVALLGSASASGAPITLFYPGKNSLEWVLSDHEGAKQFRRGSSCVSCHEGETADMGKRALAAAAEKPAGAKSHIQGELNFTQSKDRLQLEFRFAAPKEPFTLSFMFDDDRTSAFERAGCWAVCHDDMKGMPSDLGLKKYLGYTRKKLTRSGGGKELKSEAELEALLDKGVFVELWEIKVAADGKTSSEQMRVFDSLHPIEPAKLSASASYNNGAWTVTVSRPLDFAGEKSFIAAQSFGIALQNQAHQGSDHWVSLPWRFGTADNVDFKVSKK